MTLGWKSAFIKCTSAISGKDKPGEKSKKMYIRVLTTLENLEVTVTIKSNDLPKKFE